MDAKNLQTDFTAGEIMPKLYGRVDLAAYRKGAARIENMVVSPQGGVYRRPGLEWIAEVKDSSKSTRVIPFEFSTEQAYAIELGDQYLRFCRNGAPITETGVSITGVTNANPGVVTAASHGYSNGDHVIIRDVVGMEALNNVRFTVAGATTNTFELSGVDTTSYGTWSSGGMTNKVYEIAAPWLEAEIFDVQFAQDADTMWLTHPSHKTRKLTRSAHTTWTLSNYAPTADPFTSSDNYPAAVWLFENRILFGGTNTDPQKIWGSKAGDLEDFTTGTGADDAWSYAIVSGEVNRISWIRGLTSLLIGTYGKEFKASGDAEGITPSNVFVRPQTAHGSKPGVMPVELEDSVIFCQRGGRRLRKLEYAFEKDTFVGNNISILAEHLTDCGCIEQAHGIIEMAKQDQPIQIVWCVTEDGRLIGMTFEREHEVVGWHRHNTEADTDEGFESVTSISNPGGTEVWFVVKRTVNGVDKRYIERFDLGWRMEDPDDGADDQEDAFYVDSGLVYDGSPATEFFGLNHLLGEEVQVLADGAVMPNQTVADIGEGKIGFTLDNSASVVNVGLPYTSTVRTLPLEQATSIGATMGEIKSVGEVRVRLWKSLGMSIDGETIPFRKGSDAMDQPVPLFSGVKRTTLKGWDREKQIEVKQAQPLPLNVLAISGDIDLAL